ncbi:Tn3 family transposase [Streptomyces violascens]|uniref:Tn3 family transposase n=1 Tax=Streptomyces violascens TaxID=67381 RepID=UPI0036AF92C1
MLTLHLLQSALVHVNTLLLQQVLAGPARAKKQTDEDQRGLTALFWSNINPYGTFRVDMDRRLGLSGVTTARSNSVAVSAASVSKASISMNRSPSIYARTPGRSQPPMMREWAGAQRVPRPPEAWT